MPAEILVSRSPGETRVALIEDQRLVEFDLERDDHRSVVGNIYRARVSRVLPGMQAAFLDIGLERAAFLYVDDIALARDPEDVAEDEGDDESAEAVDGEDPPLSDRPPIQDLLEVGQELTVQVRKAPFGTKGARVTNYVTLPGRFVVYLPTLDRIGVSRKITDEAERKRLKELLELHRLPGEGGFIARTMCQGLPDDTIRRDMEFVRSLWSEVEERVHVKNVPSLLQADLDLVLRTARDLFTEAIDKLVCDDASEADRIRRLVIVHDPELAQRVEVHREPTDLLASRGALEALESATRRTVRLRSGGSLVFDEAEALTAIDVNTGRYVGKKDLEQTILKTNLEAAETVAAQIRLRNIGGLIIIDFIDMQEDDSRHQVFERFTEAMSRDRVKTHILPMTEFGLIELTRKRARPSLSRKLDEICPYCGGRGRIRSKESQCLEILREVRRTAEIHPSGSLWVSAMPEVARVLSESPHLLTLESMLGRQIHIESRPDYHQESFHVTLR
ncbi:MAG: ribonuclease E/G [Myxococcota bacterium]